MHKPKGVFDRARESVQISSRKSVRNFPCLIQIYFRLIVVVDFLPYRQYCGFAQFAVHCPYTVLEFYDFYLIFRWLLQLYHTVTTRVLPYFCCLYLWKCTCILLHKCPAWINREVKQTFWFYFHCTVLAIMLLGLVHLLQGLYHPFILFLSNGLLNICAFVCPCGSVCRAHKNEG